VKEATLSEYIRKRLAIGALPSPQEICDSVRKLTNEFPDVPPVYVLFNGPQEREDFEVMSAKHLQPQVRRWIRVLNIDEAERNRDAIKTAGNGWVNGRGLARFESWMDQKLARQLAGALQQNRSLLFLQFDRSSHEAFAYGVLREYQASPIQIHDLPVN
jgi:hypothetical protein